jgi:membrane fusion protein (multidrug efflux system)
MPEGSPHIVEADREVRARARPRRRAALMAGAAALAAVAVGFGAHWWTTGRFIQSTNDAYVRADQMVVAPKVNGYVTQVLVADNQEVRAGQPLVRIDTRQFQAGYDQAQASIAARQADIAAAQAEAAQQQAMIAQAEAQAASARSNAAFAAGEVDRYRPLVASGADTPEKLAQLATSRDQARQSAAAGAAAVAAAKRQAVTLQARIVQARAQLQAAQADAEQARLKLSDTVVASSIAGRVGDKTVQVGQYLAPGTRLMSVVPVSDAYVVANFKETQIGRMRAGQPVRVHVDALGGRDIPGVVESFAPGTGAEFALLPPENATGNFTKIVQRVPVRIRLRTDAEQRRRLVPGLSATVKVDTKRLPETGR